MKFIVSVVYLVISIGHPDKLVQEDLALRARCVCPSVFYMGTLGNCHTLEPGPLGSAAVSQLPALVTLGCNLLPFMHQPIICKTGKI